MLALATPQLGNFKLLADPKLAMPGSEASTSSACRPGGPMTRVLGWVLSHCAQPKAGGVILVVATLLVLPSLASPLVMHEYAQLIRFRDSQRPGGRSFLMSCFVFAEPASCRTELEHGLGAWWIAPDLKIAFFRPLAALTQAVDFALWPENAVLMHVHTLFWFVGLLVAIRALFQRFLPAAAANLVFALYAWDDARGQVLSCVANRHALIAALFGCLCLLAHERWRSGAWRAGGFWGSLSFATAWLSGEMALATLGFAGLRAVCRARTVASSASGAGAIRACPHRLAVHVYAYRLRDCGLGDVFASDAGAAPVLH